MKRKLLWFAAVSGILIVLLFSSRLIRPALHGNYQGITAKLERGMSSRQIRTLLLEGNLEYRTRKDADGEYFILGGSTWRCLFVRENELSIFVDSKHGLQFIGEDILFQGDEVGFIEHPLP